MINTRLAIGIHILSVTAQSEDPGSLNSEAIAGSIQTNPVVVRRMAGILKKAGLLTAVRGNRGLQLTRQPEEISLLDILRAADPCHTLFSVHQGANQACPVGSRIESTLTAIFQDIQKHTEMDLDRYTLKDVLDGLISPPEFIHSI